MFALNAANCFASGGSRQRTYMATSHCNRQHLNEGVRIYWFAIIAPRGHWECQTN